MNSKPTAVQKIKPKRPTMAGECARILVSRNLIAAEDMALIEEVAERFSGAEDSITSELSRRCLIPVECESIVKEFIKRTVKRYYLKTCGLTDEELGRTLGVDTALAHRILNGTAELTPEHIKKLAA